MDVGLARAAFVRSAGADGICLALSGELDMAAVQELDAWLSQATPQAPLCARVSIDLTNVSFVDAACTRVLARHYFRLVKMGIPVEGRGARRSVAKVLTILGLGDLARS
jgi:anti-anti-sigma factor